MTSPRISQTRRLLEVTAVVITAAGKFLFMDYLNWRFPFVLIATIFWITYILYRVRTERGISKYWGFRTDNFKKAFRIVLLPGLMAIVLFVVIGIFQKTINITWHILPILILYPVWGTIQQFLLIGLTAGNLNDMKGLDLAKSVIIFLSAVLFGAIHYPFVWLMVATFFLALFYGWVYLKEKNLYVLGLFHGWLGAIFYYTILDRDPFMETFGFLLK
jgi:membrane protease YdiL (CAAX protease family)